MKKRVLAIALILILSASLFTGCGTPKYTVTFDLNGGELVSGELTQTVKQGESAQLPEVSFGDKVLSWEGDPENITADTTITARWRSWYTVTFDLNGGELVSGDLEQRILEGEDAAPPQAEYGRRELSWDGDWTNVAADTEIRAAWTKVPMTTVDLAAYVQDRTVTVNVVDVDGGKSTGSGFFIDSEGTLVTNFHVVEAAAEITVETGEGASFPVKEVVDFNHLYDLAVLKLDRKDTEYLEFSDTEARTGEQVYAVGSALGTLKGSFTAGIISSTKRTYGGIDCLQMDAAISPGNSGGPLVNVYGEVVGINTASYTAGENLNLAIKTATLDRLAMDKHWSVREFKEWYERETAVSWGLVHEDYYYPCLVHTYQEVTGAKCTGSALDSKDEWITGYKVGYDCFSYDYKTAEYNQYTAYLKENGFEYMESEEYSGGTSYYYYNEKDAVLLDLYILKDNSEIIIWPMA